MSFLIVLVLEMKKIQTFICYVDDGTIANGFLLRNFLNIEEAHKPLNDILISLKLLNDSTLLWETKNDWEILPPTITFERLKKST